MVRMKINAGLASIYGNELECDELYSRMLTEMRTVEMDGHYGATVCVLSR